MRGTWTGCFLETNFAVLKIGVENWTLVRFGEDQLHNVFSVMESTDTTASDCHYLLFRLAKALLSLFQGKRT